MTAEQARGFLSAARGTPLAARFLVAYLRHKGQDRRWRQFLDVLDVPEYAGAAVLLLSGEAGYWGAS